MSKPITDQATLNLFHKLGAVVTLVSDELEEEGDRTFLGSTNHAELLKAVADLYFQWRFDYNDPGPDDILTEI